MFESLSDSLQKTFKNLRGYGRLSEKNIKDALREVRLALLEADVHYKVAKDFIADVSEKCMGEEVLESVTPGQQVTKRIHDSLVHLLGDAHQNFDLSKHPSRVMLLGLHGAGKTTSAGKLAKHWKKMGKKVLLVACDIRRPAAVDQLSLLAEQVGVDIVRPESDETVPAIGKRALSVAQTRGYDVVLFDTGGRFQIDNDLITELKELQDAVQAKNTVLVLDAAIGQESVDVAQSFNDAVGLTGLVLTKLDGDARGGAALSVHSVTGCPILMTGSGEGMDDLEPFYPDRMASRILGMGDVVSLVEKAQAAVDINDMEKMEQQLFKDSFTLEDFLMQIQQLKKLGPIENLLDMMPGDAMGKMNATQRKNMAGLSEREMKKTEAIIQSMTQRERLRPGTINAQRRKRIAKGSGTRVSDINELMKRFKQAGKMAKKFKKMQKGLRRFGK